MSIFDVTVLYDNDNNHAVKKCAKHKKNEEEDLIFDGNAQQRIAMCDFRSHGRCNPLITSRSSTFLIHTCYIFISTGALVWDYIFTLWVIICVRSIFAAGRNATSGQKKVKKSAREASDRDGRSPLLSPTIDYLVRSKSMHSNPSGDTFGKGERVRTSILYLNVYKRSGRSREKSCCLLVRVNM